MWNSKFFKTGVVILLALLIIYLGSLVSFIFLPIFIALEALFFSFVIAGVLYYLTFPCVDLLVKGRLPRPAAIAIVYIVLIGVTALFLITAGPIIVSELAELFESVPGKILETKQTIANLETMPLFSRLLNLEEMDLYSLTDGFANVTGQVFNQLSTSFTTIVDFVANLFVTIVIVPFLLFYMLKEKGGEVIKRGVVLLAPEKIREEIMSILFEVNRLLGAYVQGLSIVCLCVGILAYAGFLIIDLEYALILASFIMVTNVIPYLGPFIGSIPAIIVGFLQSPLTAIQVAIVILVVQQLESLLISPQIMGRKLSLSPLTIILVVLVAGRLGGLLGIILAIPVFTVLKILTSHALVYLRRIKNMPASGGGG